MQNIATKVQPLAPVIALQALGTEMEFPARPKHAVIYEYSGYRVKYAGGNTPPLAPA